MLRKACAAMIALAATAQTAPRDPAAEIAPKITAPFTVATVGDIIAPQPLDRAEPGFRQLVARIKAADVGFANMEASLVDFRTFPGPVGGTLAPLAVGKSIREMGITLMSRANNHALDGGVAGMVSTDEALDALGIVHAGTGDTLQEARRATFLETPKGRVGLVSMFSVEDVGSFGPTYAKTEATYRNGSMAGAPGINPLHVTTYHVVSPAHLAQLKEMARAVYGEREGASTRSATGAERFRFYDEWYEAGADAGALRYDMEEGEQRDILASIRSGKVASDFMIATIHAHQTPKFCGPCAFNNVGSGMKEGTDHYPADFVVTFAHAAIDNGADMFVTHGVHALAGIEIYKGRPIFYGLSNFVFQFGLQLGTSYDVLANHRKMAALEDPATQETVLATSRYEGGRLVEVRLHPVDLGGRRRPISQMGIPTVPSPADARRILAALQDYSRPFGTGIAIENGVGVIRLGAATR